MANVADVLLAPLIGTNERTTQTTACSNHLLHKIQFSCPDRSQHKQSWQRVVAQNRYFRAAACCGKLHAAPLAKCLCGPERAATLHESPQPSFRDGLFAQPCCPAFGARFFWICCCGCACGLGVQLCSPTHPARAHGGRMCRFAGFTVCPYPCGFNVLFCIVCGDPSVGGVPAKLAAVVCLRCSLWRRWVCQRRQ